MFMEQMLCKYDTAVPMINYTLRHVCGIGGFTPQGPTMYQAVGCCCCTVDARGQFQDLTCRICGEQSGSGRDFSAMNCFTISTSFHQCPKSIQSFILHYVTQTQQQRVSLDKEVKNYFTHF
jgi:hypothetical protein